MFSAWGSRGWPARASPVPMRLWSERGGGQRPAQLPLTSLSPSLPALTPSSTRMENLTWMRPWTSPGTWRNSYAARWTVWTRASPRLPAFSPLPEARSHECSNPTLLFGNNTQCEGGVLMVILVLLGVRMPPLCVCVCACLACAQEPPACSPDQGAREPARPVSVAGGAPLLPAAVTGAVPAWAFPASPLFEGNYSRRGLEMGHVSQLKLYS